MSKDSEVRAVATELKAELDKLREAVRELTAILLPPEAHASKEQVVT